MSYESADIPNLAAGEVGYKLTSDPCNGAYVACLWVCTRRQNQTLDCVWHVREVDANGSPVTDAGGQPIKTCYCHPHAPAHIVADGGMAAVKTQMLEVVLGEPDAVIDIDDDIRDAITAASFVT